MDKTLHSKQKIKKNHFSKAERGRPKADRAKRLQFCFGSNELDNKKTANY